MAKYPEELQNLIELLKKLPGVGNRTAERFAFEIIQWERDELTHCGQTIASIQSKIAPCPTCGCLTEKGSCRFCDVTLRDARSLCILASSRDVYAIESTKTFRGLYHVIEHLLSPLDGRYVSSLNVERIASRVIECNIQEIIIALDSTLEGDTTALYLKEKLSPLNRKITRLAFGIPVGSAIDHIDCGTLSRALTGRQTI